MKPLHKPLYSSPATLASWSQSASGQRLTLELENENSIIPFRGLPVGKRSGQRLMVTIHAIDDGGNVQSERIAKGIEKEKKPFSTASQIAMYCTKPEFLKWLTTYGLDFSTAEKVRSYFGVESRSEINDDPEKVALWTTLLNGYEVEKKEEYNRAQDEHYAQHF